MFVFCTEAIIERVIRMRTAYYTDRLNEEREQMAAVRDALGALDIERLRAAAERINSPSLLRCTEDVAAMAPVADALRLLEQMSQHLAARIAHLKPLAQRECKAEWDMQEREYRLSL
jgi:hypothetical protein